jgi:hypothetical protein
MFWGEGDSSRLGAQEQKTLQQLRRMAETGHIRALSPRESEIAIEAINFYATVRSAQTFLVGLRNVLVFTGALVGIWWATGDAVVAILQRILNSGTPG